MLSFFRQILNSIRTQNSFGQNVAWTFSSKSLATLLAFFVTPILTRLYTPYEYGIFSAFMIITNNYLTVSNLSYSEAMLVVRKRQTFYNIFFTSFFISVIFLLILIPFLPIILYRLFQITDNHFNLSLLIIFAGFIGSLFLLLQRANFFMNRFKRGAVLGTTYTLLNRSGSLTLGFYSVFGGLIISEVISKAIVAVLNFRFYAKHIQFFLRKYSIQNFKKVLQEYKRYPFFILPAKYMEVLFSQIPMLIIAPIFGLAILGQYGLVVGFITIPVGLLGYSMQGVYLRRVRDASEVDISTITYRLIKFLAILVIGPSMFISLVSTSVIPWVLGSEWGLAGEMTSIMILVLFHLILDAVTSGLFQLKSKEKGLFLYNAFSTILLFSVLMFLAQLDYEIHYLILAQSAILVFITGIKVHYILTKTSQKSRLLSGVLTFVVLSIIILKFFIILPPLV